MTALARSAPTARAVAACRASSAAATGCRRRSSRRRWSRPCSTSCDRPRRATHFTVGIVDDVTRTVAAVRRRDFDIEPADTRRAPCSSASAPTARSAPTRTRSRSSARRRDNYAQGYFVYDSKKSGAITISHLRFGPRPIRAPYLISQAVFVACHQFDFLERYDVLDAAAARRGVSPERAVRRRRRSGTRCRSTCRRQILEQAAALLRHRRATTVARAAGMGTRINTIMQTCFFAHLRRAAARRGDRPHQGRDREDLRASAAPRSCSGTSTPSTTTLAHLHEVPCPRRRPPRTARGRRSCRRTRPTSCKRVTAVMLAGPGRPAAGQRVPGRRHVADRHDAVGEAQPRDARSRCGTPALCIQCNKCALVCPHAAIRAKVYPRRALAGAPGDVQVALPYQGQRTSTDATTRIQVAPEDCTGCSLCVRGLPGEGQGATRATRRSTWRRRPPLRDARARQLRVLPRAARSRSHDASRHDVKGTQFLAAAVRVLRRLRRLRRDAVPQAADAAVRRSRCCIANATGCSSIYGGNLPTTPYTHEPRRPRSGLGQLAVRGQRRVRPRHAAGGRSARSGARATCCATLGAVLPATRCVDDAARRATSRPRRASQAQRERVVALREAARGLDDCPTRRELLDCWPTTW